MGSEKFCLRWNDFENNISQAFRDLRQDEDFFDCTIACEDDQIPAHKVILSACSVFFKDVLRKNPHQHPLVYMKGVRMRELVSLVNFMYHGEVNVAQDELNGFLAVAEDLKVKGLTQSSTRQHENTPSFTDKSPQPRQSPQLSPGYRNTEPPPTKKQKILKNLPASSNHELGVKSNRVTPTSARKAIAVKSEPVTSHQDTALDTSQISNHSDQFGQGERSSDQDQYGGGDYEYGGYGEAGDTQEDMSMNADYGNAMAVVEDQVDNQSIQDNGNTASAAADVLLEITVDDVYDNKGAIHQQKLFSCSVCGKSGKQRRDIRDHIEVNHATSDYYCPYCGHQFRAHVYLRNHVTAKHRDEHKMAKFKMNYN